MKLPRASGREVIKALSKIGFVVDRQKGSHVRLIKFKGPEVRKVTVPVHSNKPLKPGTLLAIIRDAGINERTILRVALKKYHDVDERFTID